MARFRALGTALLLALATTVTATATATATATVTDSSASRQASSIPVGQAVQHHQYGVAGRSLAPAAAEGAFRTIGAFGGTVDALALDDNYVYAAAGARLVVLMADAEAQVVGKSSPVTKPMQALVVIGHHVYGSASRGSLFVFDVSEPVSPTLVAHARLPTDGDLVFLAGTGQQLFASSAWCDPAAGPCEYGQPDGAGWQYQTWAIDTSKPTVPLITNTIDGVAGRLAASESRLYVRAWTFGLRVFTFSPQAGFEELWSREDKDSTAGSAIAVDEPHLYLIHDLFRGSSLEVLDFTDQRAPTTVATLESEEDLRGLFIEGDRLHVVTKGTLYVYDEKAHGVTGPAHRHSLPNFSSAFVVRGSTVFVGGESLAILDITSEQQVPALLGSTNPGTWTAGMVVVGDVAYAAHGRDGLTILDLSGAPVEIGRVEYEDTSIRQVTASEDLIVVFASRTSPEGARSVLITYEASGRGQLVEIGRFEADSFGSSTPFLKDGFVYADTGYDGHLDVFDVRDPARPLQVASAPFLAPPFEAKHHGTDIFIDGGLAFITLTRAGAVPSGGVVILDISDPANPVRVGQFEGFDAHAVHVHDGHAYLASRVGLVVLDVSDPTRPHEVARLADAGATRDLDGVGPRILVAADDQLRLVDASIPGNPQLVATGGLGKHSWSAHEVAASSDRALVQAGSGAARDLVAFDIEAWARSRVSKRLRNSIGADDMSLHGNTAVLASLYEGLQMVDVGVRSGPRRVGALDHGWPAYDVHATESLAFVNAGSGGGFKVLDVSDPAQPSEAATYWPQDPEDGWTHVSTGNFALGDGHAFVLVNADSRAGWISTGLAVLDIADPRHPTMIAWVALKHDGDSYYARFATSHGDHVALTSAESVVLIDVSDSIAPAVIAAHDIDEDIRDVAAIDEYLCLLSTDGLLVLDTSDPTDLRRVGSLPMDAPDSGAHDLAMGVFGSRRLVSIVAGAQLTLVDVSDPSQPVVIAQRPQPFGWRFLSSAVDGSHVYLSTTAGGFQVLQAETLRADLKHQVVLPLVSVR